MSTRTNPTEPQRNNQKKKSRYRKRQEHKRRKNQARIEQEVKWEEHEICPIKDVLTKLQQSSQTDLAPLKSLEGRYFKLWSTDHVKYCTVEVAPTQYIEFYDPKFRTCDMLPKGQVSGHIYAASDAMCYIDPFVHPQNAGLETVRIDGNNKRHTFDAQFLDDNYLILHIPKDLVFYKQKMKPPSKAPDVFTYYGVCSAYYESLIRAKERREEQTDRRRSASPA
ncbi:hypothetical protein FPANT_4077 [Fusarium pseudoanthophilum]|uniref:Uncharacterized protein n=1 Tax=Fusarium pseudoanthophilum TaxID=48495 RepID=A0A8H5PJ33_9HYPO|nr:hypothetical protein FPANT_4077 [Fusarium pseudoanthophilum]